MLVLRTLYMERFGCEISFMIMQLQFQPKKKFDDRQMKFLGEMIIVAFLVKILIFCHYITKTAVNTEKIVKNIGRKMQKILEITRAKTVNTEKVVKNIGLKLQKILEIVKPKTVNTEKIVKNIGLTSVNTRKY